VEIGASEKQEFLGNAAALLFPIHGLNTFGLVMIRVHGLVEPGSDCASVLVPVPEIIPDGVAGLSGRDLDESGWAVKNLGDLDRRECRATLN